MKTWAVIGGGNGGQATAAHLAITGKKVRIYDVFDTTVDAINAQGGIYADGIIEGFGKLEFATTDMAKAIEGADNIIVTAPSFAHGDIAKKLAPLIREHHKVLLHPATMFGSLVFLKEMRDCGNPAKIVIGEAISLMYAARLKEAGRVSILGKKNIMPYATVPANRSEEFIEEFREMYPQLSTPNKNILVNGLQNIGFIVHPVPTILSTSLVESDRDWKYYYDGVTPSVAKVMQAMDNERMQLGKLLGIEVESVVDQYYSMYSVTGDTIDEVMHKVDAYDTIAGQHTMNTRYITEEIPFSLAPVISLADKAGTSHETMKNIYSLAKIILGDDLVKNERTLKSVDLDHLNIEQVLEFVETGVMPE